MGQKKPSLTVRAASLERRLAVLEKRFARTIDEMERRHALAVSSMDDAYDELTSRVTEVEDVGERIAAERAEYGTALRSALRDLISGNRAASMPSKSESQARLMAAAAHTKGGYGGVPQKVGKEFNQADKGSKLLSRSAKHKHGDSSKTSRK
jgi:hypothetical protein